MRIFCRNFEKILDKRDRVCYNIPVLWGYSSVGRALEWHSRGQGFDSPYLHQNIRTIRYGCFFVFWQKDADSMGQGGRYPLFRFIYSIFVPNILHGKVLHISCIHVIMNLIVIQPSHQGDTYEIQEIHHPPAGAVHASFLHGRLRKHRNCRNHH